ncbi:hypothetical protein P691DRAFT_765313 [Macrolepiota fuliginosa MF-IS2]|uniref:Uncharacterized protein n=1 Tax=Macrolepiota fuliginosa MF-IS2 TaxID=1400762 RepID=A0A9P5X2Q7_9AGAR|nr:hypothetical protein P691DRAFT_765313 [Macrolepiota fuliginosa MF-IS2]
MAGPNKPRSKRAVFKGFFSRLSHNIVPRPTSPASTTPSAPSPPESTPAAAIIGAPRSEHNARAPINVTGPQYNHNNVKRPTDTPDDGAGSMRVTARLGSLSNTMAHSEPPKNTNLAPALNIAPPSDEETHAHSNVAIAQGGRRPASMYSSDVSTPPNNDITPSSNFVLTSNETIPPAPSIAVTPPNNPTHSSSIAAASPVATPVDLGAPSRSNSPAITSPHPRVIPQMVNPPEASVTTPGAFAGASGWIVENFNIYSQETISHTSSGESCVYSNCV